MSTDHSLLVGVSQTPVQSSGGLSSTNSTPPPSQPPSTQQLHAASARRSVNTQYQLDADSYNYYVCLTQPIGHGKNGTDNCTQQYRTRLKTTYNTGAGRIDYTRPCMQMLLERFWTLSTEQELVQKIFLQDRNYWPPTTKALKRLPFFYFNHGRYQVAAATTPPLLLRFWPMTNLLIALLLVVSMISVTCLETIVEVRQHGFRVGSPIIYRLNKDIDEFIRRLCQTKLYTNIIQYSVV